MEEVGGTGMTTEHPIEVLRRETYASRIQEATASVLEDMKEADALPISVSLDESQQFMEDVAAGLYARVWRNSGDDGIYAWDSQEIEVDTKPLPEYKTFWQLVKEWWRKL